jgi:L-cystine uptake protein TcyP (sodium:dicarboxylate symporter family)
MLSINIKFGMIKKVAFRVLAFIVLFVVVSIILEGEYTLAMLQKKLRDGLVIGFIYGIILWAVYEWNNKKRKL